MSRTIASALVLAVLSGACGQPVPTATPAPTPTPAASATPGSSLPSPTPAPTASALEIDPAQLTQSGGCGDAFVWAANANGTAALTIQWDGAASAAWANSGFQDSVQLPVQNVRVAIDEGIGLNRYYCNDVREPGQGTTSTTEAVTGTVELVVRPDPQGFQPASHADVRISDVTFNVSVGGAEQVWHLDELVIQNVSVGWFAG